MTSLITIEKAMRNMLTQNQSRHAQPPRRMLGSLERKEPKQDTHTWKGGGYSEPKEGKR